MSGESEQSRPSSPVLSFKEKPLFTIIKKETIRKLLTLPSAILKEEPKIPESSVTTHKEKNVHIKSGPLQKSLFIKKSTSPKRGRKPAIEPLPFDQLFKQMLQKYEFGKKSYLKLNGYKISEVDPRYMPFMYQAMKTLKDMHGDELSQSPDVPLSSEFRCLHKPVLVLNLDRTLVYCSKYQGKPSRFEPIITYHCKELNKLVTYKVNIRPFTAYFLEKVSTYYDVVVYNSTSADYTKAVCRVLDPQKKIIKGILSKEDCLISKLGAAVKDLRLVSGLDTSRTVLVDSSVQSFAPRS